MAKYKAGYYIEVFVVGSSDTAPGSWVRMYAGQTEEEMQKKGNEYLRQKYQVNFIGFRQNDKIPDAK